MCVNGCINTHPRGDQVTELRKCFCLCMQIVATSVRLFMLFGLLMFEMMNSFSVRQRLQYFCPGLYVSHCCRMLHFTGGSIIFPVSSLFKRFVQMNLESVVEFCLSSSLNVCLCEVMRSFTCPEVIPMYDASFTSAQ